MNEELKKRLKSLAWQFCCVALIAGIAFLSGQLDSFGLPEFAVLLIGSVLAQITKLLENNKRRFGSRLKFKD